MLGTINKDDEMFGNEWRIWLNSEGVEINARPTQYAGVHGLLKHNDNIFLLSEDDGHFRDICILTEDEIETLRLHLAKLLTKFQFLGNYKVRFDTHMEMIRTISEDMSLTIEPRNDGAPLIDMLMKGKRVQFDVNWLSDLVKVLDINNPIK